LNQSTHSRVANSTASKLRQGAAPVDYLGFVEAVEGLGQGIVVAVAGAADRGLDARLGKPLGILDRNVLHTAIAVVDEAATPDRPALVQGLLQCVQHKAGVSGARDTPTDDAPGKGVDDEGDIDEAGPRRDVGEVGHPQGVRARRSSSSQELEPPGNPVRFKALLGVRPALQDQLAQSGRGRADRGGLLANAPDRPVGVAAVARRHVCGHGGVPVIAAGAAARRSVRP
jgi:hypothetical protein